MADEDDDIISRLPDDILVSIIARLPSTRDVHRTSVVSKRWMNLHKLVPHVSLSCSDFLSPAAYSHYPHKCWRTHFDFLYGRFTSDRYLKMLYKGQHKIRSLQLRCCISKHEESSFDRYFFYYLQHSGVESLDLCFSCRDDPSDLCFDIFPLHLVRSLKLLRLSLCILQPLMHMFGFGNGREDSYSHLQTLEFTSVKVLPKSLETILSTCLRIHSLSILECDCPDEISIPAAAANLNSLTIRHCRGVEEIHVCATNLTLLEFVSSSEEMGVDFKFVRLPHLQTLHYFCVQGKDLMLLVFWISANYFPNLRSLTLTTMNDFFHEKSSSLMTKVVGIGMFVELRKLELRACCTLNVNLLSLIPILQNCPILEEFHLDLQNLDYEKGPQPIESSKNYDYLKKAEMSGFNGEENEIEFALHILRSAPVLEQMRVTWYPKCYHRCCGWKTMAREKGKWNKEAIQQKLEGQALSKNAQLVIVD